MDNMSSELVDRARQSGATDEQCSQISESEKYLNHTDYVIIKIYEAVINAPNTVDSLKNEYRDVLQRRPTERARIDTILNNL